MDEYVKKLWKKVDEQTNELNEAKRAMRPYTEALKEVREARRQIISEQEEAAKENGMTLFAFLKSDLNIPFEQRYSELKAKEAEIEKEKKPYEETVEKIAKKITATKKQIEDYQTNNKLRQYREELEASGLSEADFRRQQILENKGTTDLVEMACYVFPDGSLIKRNDDHRFVAAYFEPGSVESNDQETALYSFINEGNIRWMPEGLTMTVSLCHPLTDEQEDAIYKIVDYAKKYAMAAPGRNIVTGKDVERSFDIDLIDANENVVKSFSYDKVHLSAKKVLDAINGKTEMHISFQR